MPLLVVAMLTLQAPQAQACLGPPQGLSNIIPTAGFEGGPVECDTSPTLWSTVQDRVYS